METQLNTYEHWADIHLSKEDAEKFFINMANEVEANTPDMTVQEHDFIYSAFVWDRSNEGHLFWQGIHNNLKKKNGWEDGWEV